MKCVQIKPTEEQISRWLAQARVFRSFSARILPAVLYLSLQRFPFTVQLSLVGDLIPGYVCEKSKNWFVWIDYAQTILNNINFCQQRSCGRFEHVIGCIVLFFFFFLVFRDSIKERRGYRQRSPDNDRESNRGEQRLHMDRDENRREHRKQNISERLGQRPRKSDSQEEREDNEDPSTSRWKQKNERYCEYTCRIGSWIHTII